MMKFTLVNFIIRNYSQSDTICSFVELFLTTYSTESSDFGNDEIHSFKYFIKNNISTSAVVNLFFCGYCSSDIFKLRNPQISSEFRKLKNPRNFTKLRKVRKLTILHKF